MRILGHTRSVRFPDGITYPQRRMRLDAQRPATKGGEMKRWLKRNLGDQLAVARTPFEPGPLGDEVPRAEAPPCVGPPQPRLPALGS